MKLTRISAIKVLGVICLASWVMPKRASAQTTSAMGAQGMGQIMKQLDLTPDQQSKIQEILRQVQQDVRDARQGLQDASPDERQTKLQEIQKMMTDARTKVEAELTPEQKAKYYPLTAQTALNTEADLVAALKSAAAKLDIPDDQHKQLNDIFDDSAKTLDGFKSDADAVTDSQGSTDFTQRVTRFQLDLRKQVVDVIGQQNAQTLIQTARQSMTGVSQRQSNTATATTTTAPTPAK